MASSLLTEFAGADVVLRGTPAAAGGEEQITGLFGGYGSGQWGGAWNIGRDGGTGVLNTGSIAAPGSNDSTSWLNVRGGGIVKTVNANANGLLGLKTSVTGTNGVDFATVAGDGFVQPFTNYATYNLTAALPSGTSTGLLTGGGRVATAASGQALKIVNSGASDILDVNAGLGVGAGGSVLYAGGGDGKYTITGTGVILGNGRSGFYVAQDAELTLAAGGISATDNIASWAKSGPGTLVLALQRDWNSSGLGAGATLEGVTRWTNSNWFRLGWAVANSPAGSAVEFAPGAGLTGITSPSGVTATIGGGGINDQGAIRSRFGDNAILGNVFVQQPGARIHADAGTLRLSGTLDVPPNGHLSPTVTFGGAGTVLVDGPGNGITSSLIVNKDGPGTLIVTATSTYTGTTAVTGGELVWGRRVAFYNADTTKWNAFNFTTGSGAAMSFRVGDAAGAFTDADIATLATVGTNMGGFMAGSYIGLDTTGASSGSYAYAGNFADTAGGALGVAKSGSGTLTLTGTANTFTGGVLVRGGRLLLTGTNQIGSGVAVADGGLLDVNNQPITNAFSIRSGTIANATFEVSRLTANLNGPGLVSATLTGTGGLVKTGTGTLALSANNSFTGPTTLSQGLVSIGSDANLNGTSSALVFAGGGLQVTGTSLTALNPGRTTTFTPGSTVLFDVADPRNSFAVPQTLDQGAGGLTKSGSGTLRLAAASTYSGTTTISGGVLRLDDAGSLPGGIGATGGSSPLVLAGGVVGLAAGDFTRAIGSGTDQVWFGTGGGGFAAYGADRTVNLGGATAQITWNSATAGFRSQPLVLGAPTATNKVTLVNPLALGLDDRTVRVDDGSADVDGELSGVLSGSGGIVKTGAGRLVLSNANTYLGTTTVSGGVLRPGNALAIGGTANAITVNGGVLDLADYSLTRSAVVSLTSGTIASGTLAFTGTNAAFANGYVSSVVTGTMGFTVTSGNTLSFAGLNTYTGKVAAQSGVLEAAIVSGSGQASSLGSGTGANATIDLGNLATGGTFRYVGSTSATTNRIFNLSGTTGGGAIEANSVGALVISSTVTATGVGVKTLTLGGTSTAANTIGAISNGSGTTSVVKDGPGLWRINAVSSYTGSFTVRNGTLVAAADSTSTNGAFGAGSVTDVFVGDSSPTATGTAALLLAAGFNTTKVMNVQAGGGSQVVVLGGEGGAVDFQSSTYLGRGVTLVAGAGGTTSFSGFWYGSGGAGTSPTGNVSIGSAGNTGMVRVLRNLAPSGSVGVRFGTLSLGSTGTIAGSGPLAIDAGATLAGIGWVTGTLGGAGLVAPGNSPGILTAGAIDPLGGLDWAFELTGTAPDYTNSFNSVNDVLRLTGTGSSPFTTNLTGSNAIGVYFDVGSLTQGDTFRGGFFTDLGSDFRSSVIDATYAYWVTGSGVGQTTYESKTYVPLSSVYPSLGVAVTTVSDTASFSGGSPVTGQVMQFTVVVPEPGALALAALGLGLAGYALRRRRAA
jgi:autotransporter-associated beta strand protein